MKAISILLLAILVSCNNQMASGQRNKNVTHQSAPYTSEAPAHEHHPAPATVPVPEVTVEENPNAHDLVIEIDQVNSILTITGYAGKVCGIDFLVPHKMHYEVHSTTQAQITLNGRVFELERIGDSDKPEIFGDWTTAIDDENYSGHLIFQIRLDPVLKLEANCEKLN